RQSRKAFVLKPLMRFCLNMALCGSARPLCKHLRLFLGTFPAQPFPNRLKHCFNIRIHADPVRTGAAVAIYAAADVVSLYAYVVRVRAAVSPPFCRSEQSDDRSSCRDRQVCRAGVAANVDCRMLCQLIEAF